MEELELDEEAQAFIAQDGVSETLKAFKTELEALEKATHKQLLTMRGLRKEMRSAISSAFVDVMVNLKERYPTLTGDDVFYCVLSLLCCSKFVVMELMDATSDALKTRKSRIKNKIDAQIFERVFGLDNQ